MPFIDPITVHDPSVGVGAPSAWGDAVRNAIAFLADPPRARVKRSAVQGIPNNTVTAVLWDQEDYDTDTIHDVVTATSRLTCKTAGLYHIQATIQFAAHATGFRLVQIVHSSGAEIANFTLPATGAAVTCSLFCATDYRLAVNEWVNVNVWQTSGTTLNVDTVSRFMMRWVSL